MTSTRPPDATATSAPNRSPLAAAITRGADHWVASVTPLADADVKKTCAKPSGAISAYTTSSRLRVASNAAAGYEPGPRNGFPEMLKQNDGNKHTGLLYRAKITGV